MSVESRMLIALGTGQDIGDAPTVILGLTDASWADLMGGKAQDVDLRKLGIPALLLVMRGTDHADIERQLREVAGALDIPTLGLADLSIPTPRKQ